MDKQKFFAALHGGPLFPHGFNQPQVDCVSELLDACTQWGVTDLRQQANVLGQTYHETGPQRAVCMTPIREGFAATDQGAINAVNNLYFRGLIRTNYAKPDPRTGKSYFGRGFIQLTWYDNYKKFGELLKVDLLNHPEWALAKNIAADIAVVGMRDGVFRKGHNLARYFNGKKVDWVGARNIVNGDVAKNGAAVARYSKLFWDALNTASEAPEARIETLADVPPPASARNAPDTPEAVPAPSIKEANLAYVQKLLREKNYYEVGTPDGELGEMTGDAVLLFRKYNGLPLSTEIDAEFLAALEKAPPRPIPAARAEQPVEVIATKVEVVHNSLVTEWWNKLVAAIMGFGTFIGTLFSFLTPVKEWVDQNLAWITKIPTPVYIAICFLGVLFLYYRSQLTTKAGAEEFRKGKIK